MLAYQQSVEALSRRLLRLFASALDLPINTLLQSFTRPTSRLKLNHYPPQQDPVSENNIGVVPHTDSGCFTILWQDDNGGLDVQNQQGDWVGAPPLEGSFVVNIGNILQYWSNGRFSSTPHRVINRNGGDRYSIPFFVNPDFETVIEPLPRIDEPGFDTFEYGKYQVDLWVIPFQSQIFPDYPGADSPRGECKTAGPTRKHRANVLAVGLLVVILMRINHNPPLSS